MGHWEDSGKTDEWFTPKYVFDALGCYFDLDVAHPKEVKTHVPCRKYYWEKSLEKDWHGFVWMNPPFGGRNGLLPWLEKFIQHGDGVALVPDRTSAPWFQTYAKKMDIILFVSPKIKFVKPDGTTGNSPSTGTALMAIGNNGVAAIKKAQSLGLICLPVKELERQSNG